MQAVTVIEPVREVKEVKIEITYSKERIKEIIKETFPKNAEVMIKVAACEGGIRMNAPDNPTNGSYDQGVYQISKKYHGTRTKRLALNMHDVRDNIEYAKILYDEQGLAPWSASKHCWSK